MQLNPNVIWIGRIMAAGLLAVLLPALCFAEPGNPAETPLPKQVTPEIGLTDTLRFVVRPTIFGLVPPPDAANYGEVFIRVREVNEGGPLKLYYEIKEEVPGIRRENESLRRKLKPKTTIRRGFITAACKAGENYIMPPLFWRDGDFETASSLLWLTRQQFSALKLSSQIAWDIAAPAEMPGQAKSDYLLALEKLGGNALDSAVLQIVEESASYPVVVNGARTRVPAIRAIDSLGLAEYWILDNPDNPLVLKLTYISGWATGGTEGAEGYNIFNGGGFAVVELDF